MTQRQQHGQTFTVRRGLAIAAVLAIGAAMPAYAYGPHRPHVPQGCTAVGPDAGCTFTATAFTTQVEAVDAPQWSLFVVTRHGHLDRVDVDPSTCFGHADFSPAAYMCFVTLPAGARVQLVVHSPGVVRAGDDVCAVDPLCMSTS